MKNLCGAAFLAAVFLVGCGQRAAEAPTSPPTAAAPPATLVVAKPVQDHNYVVKDGLEYGYTSALSEDARKSGQVAPQVLMFRYAGQRDGKHQVHMANGTTVTALECANPCEVIKAMTFIDQDYLRSTVHVERIVYQPGSVAYAVLQDAFSGKLHQSGMERGGKNYQVWVEEKRGFKEYPAAAPAKSPA